MAEDGGEQIQSHQGVQEPECRIPFCRKRDGEQRFPRERLFRSQSRDTKEDDRPNKRRNGDFGKSSFQECAGICLDRKEKRSGNHEKQADAGSGQIAQCR